MSFSRQAMAAGSGEFVTSGAAMWARARACVHRKGYQKIPEHARMGLCPVGL